MRKLAVLFLLTFLFIGFIGVPLAKADLPVPAKPVAEKTKDFVFIPTNTNAKEFHLCSLNSWLRDNPNKKIISLASVPFNSDNIAGYIVCYETGDNSHQKLIIIECGDVLDHDNALKVLTAWQRENIATKICTFTVTPPSRGSTLGFTVCYEDR